MICRTVGPRDFRFTCHEWRRRPERRCTWISRPLDSPSVCFAVRCLRCSGSFACCLPARSPCAACQRPTEDRRMGLMALRLASMDLPRSTRPRSTARPTDPRRAPVGRSGFPAASAPPVAGIRCARRSGLAEPVLFVAPADSSVALARAARQRGSVARRPVPAAPAAARVRSAARVPPARRATCAAATGRAWRVGETCSCAAGARPVRPDSPVRAGCAPRAARLASCAAERPASRRRPVATIPGTARPAAR
jgi:hypothetical protein